VSEPEKRPERRPFTASRLLAYSAGGLLVGFGLCGVGMVCSGDRGLPDWAGLSLAALMWLSVGGFVFGIVWAVVEAIVNALHPKAGSEEDK